MKTILRAAIIAATVLGGVSAVSAQPDYQNAKQFFEQMSRYGS